MPRHIADQNNALRRLSLRNGFEQIVRKRETFDTAVKRIYKLLTFIKSRRNKAGGFDLYAASDCVRTKTHALADKAALFSSERRACVKA